eukprot:TRINITY_DN2689_c0_g1_i2.p1 TRINITY_DN2689_c0_g1~~TRINITY_DN2689_c0_g1_i2.p1  ORF type:complete len:638 (+),score=240.90 TRINITY_DN2689_c0_g1_i2:83-1996(+)
MEEKSEVNDAKSMEVPPSPQPVTDSSYSELDACVASLGASFKDTVPKRNTTDNGRLNIDGILKDILQEDQKLSNMSFLQNSTEISSEISPTNSSVFSLDVSIDDSNTPRVLTPQVPHKSLQEVKKNDEKSEKIEKKSEENVEKSAEKSEKSSEKSEEKSEKSGEEPLKEKVEEKSEKVEEKKSEEPKRSQPEKSVSFSSNVPNSLPNQSLEDNKSNSATGRSNRMSFSSAFSLGKSKSFEGGALRKKNKLKNSVSGESQNEEAEESKDEKRKSIFGTLKKKENKRQSTLVDAAEEIPLSEADLDELVVTLTSPDEGVKLSKKHKGVECASGSKITNWTKDTLHIDQLAALNIGQRGFLERGIIEPLSSKVNSFQDKSDVYYKFKLLDTKETVLNLGKIYKEEVKDAVVLSKSLVEKAISLLESSKNSEGKYSFGSIFGSKEYIRFELLSTGLQKVDLNSMGEVDRSTFYVNVANSLSLHSRFILGEPTNNLERKELLQRKYLIGSQELSSVDLIECVRGVPTAKGPKGIKEPMLHCLLFDGTDRSPRISAVESSQLGKEQLKWRIGDYLSKNVTINSAEGEVWLPKYFKEVHTDYSDEKEFTTNLTEFMNSTYLKNYGTQVDVRYFDNSFNNVQYLP